MCELAHQLPAHVPKQSDNVGVMAEYTSIIVFTRYVIKLFSFVCLLQCCYIMIRSIMLRS